MCISNVRIKALIVCDICFLSGREEAILLRYNFIAMKKIIAPLFIIALILAHMVLRLVSANAFILHENHESTQEMALHSRSQAKQEEQRTLSPYRSSTGLKAVNY